MSSPISGFTAVPNPYMVPLLYYQSLLIGAGFGIGYQGMRRKLSAMSNEDFNKLDLGTFAFDQFKEITAKSHFDKALNMMHPIMDKLAAAFGQMINKLPDNFLSFFRGVQQGPPGPTDTSTSASNILYGGSFGLPAGLLKGLQPGTQQFKDTQDLIDKFLGDIAKFKQTPKKKTTPSKAHKHTVGHHFVASTVAKPQPIRQTISQSAERKKILLNQVRYYTQRISQQRNLLLRLPKAAPKSPRNSGQGSASRSRINQQWQRYDRVFKTMKNQLLDMIKKLANAKTLLRNFR